MDRRILTIIDRAFIILKAAVEREKAVQAIDVHREWKNCVVTFWVMSQLFHFLGASRGCADFRDPTAVFRIIGLKGGRITMSSSLNLTLTDELRAFIDRNCGDGTLYATPTEFMRDVLREKKERLEADELRAGLLEGYQDAIAGRTITFSGNLKADMVQFRKRSK
jgi:antitoxin ParD1/3/4